MFVIIENHLKRIAAGKANLFHFQLRRRIGKRATAILETRLRNLILLMPRLLSRAYTHCSRGEVPSEMKKLTGFTLTYLYHPMDILPDGEDTLFGYLDDAYFVALAYEEILREISKDGEGRLDRFDRDFLRNIPLLKRSVSLVIPDEARKISEVVHGLLNGRPEAFHAAIV